MEAAELFRLAEEARKKAYCPYSGFAVGAAVLCEDGNVYTGCNIENAAFGPTNCAERTAVFTAVAAGSRTLAKIAVAGGKEGEALEVCYPCGTCRQVLAEFSDIHRLEVICGNSKEELRIIKLDELLPYSFQL